MALEASGAEEEVNFSKRLTRLTKETEDPIYGRCI